MNRNRLTWLLAFSLAMNLGAIGTLAYLNYRNRPETVGHQAPRPLLFREVKQTLGLSQDQRRALEGLLPEHRRRVREMRMELALRRRDLFKIMCGDNPAWAEVQAKIGEIGGLQGELGEEAVRFCLEARKHLNPEQRLAFINLLEQRIHEEKGGSWGPRAHGKN